MPKGQSILAGSTENAVARLIEDSRKAFGFHLDWRLSSKGLENQQANWTDPGGEDGSCSSAHLDLMSMLTQHPLL